MRNLGKLSQKQTAECVCRAWESRERGKWRASCKGQQFRKRRSLWRALVPQNRSSGSFFYFMHFLQFFIIKHYLLSAHLLLKFPTLVYFYTLNLLSVHISWKNSLCYLCTWILLTSLVTCPITSLALSIPSSLKDFLCYDATHETKYDFENL